MPTPRFDPLLTALRSNVGASARSYILPERRVMFVSLNKNACTSLKWMLADLAGEDLGRFKPYLMPYVSDDESVHNRVLWHKTPTLGKLDPALRAQIHPDNGWFVFAVVRDPRTRVFSAWQNKLLMQHPGVIDWRDEPWYPRHPCDEQTIVEDFARFVDLLENEPEHRLRRIDAHFRDQADLLMLDSVSYSQIYEIGEITTLRTDLEAHLKLLGWDGELLMRRSNPTLLAPNARVFGNGIRERLERIYAADFQLFGDQWNFTRIEAAPPWSAAALVEVEVISRLYRRIGDLREVAYARTVAADQAARRTARRKARLARIRAMGAKDIARALGRRIRMLPKQARSGRSASTT